MGLTKIEHPIHKNHVLLLKRPNEPFKCNGCKELGFGQCYECEDEKCNFYLHEECANAPPSSSHPFFNCNLKFHQKVPQQGVRYCDACGKDVLGFVYQCTHRDYPHDFHPCCLKLPRTLTAEDGMTLHLKKKLPSSWLPSPSRSGCLSCRSREISKGIKSWCYVSSCGEYRYHVACVKDMILEKWKQGYFLADGNVNEMNYLALQSSNRSQEVGLPRGERWGTAKRTWKKAKTVIMLIVSALFGDPTALISIIVEQLLAN